MIVHPSNSSDFFEPFPWNLGFGMILPTWHSGHTRDAFLTAGFCRSHVLHSNTSIAHRAHYSSKSTAHAIVHHTTADRYRYTCTSSHDVRKKTIQKKIKKIKKRRGEVMIEWQYADNTYTHQHARAYLGLCLVPLPRLAAVSALADDFAGLGAVREALVEGVVLAHPTTSQSVSV